MKKAFCIAFLLISAYPFGKAQDVIMDKKVDKEELFEKEEGPNLKKFSHLYVDYGAFAGPAEGDGAKIDYLRSDFWGIGFRYKYKLGQFYGLGFDLEFKNWSYRIKQNEEKTFPNDALHEKERISFHNLGGDVYNRLSFTKQGNWIGFFIDFGAFAYWTMNAKHVTFDNTVPDDFHAKEEKSVYKKLSYVENLNYGPFVRIGYNRYVITAHYRYSELFKNDYNHPELPRLVIGLQMGLH